MSLRLLHYWRNSLANSVLRAESVRQLEQSVRVPSNELWRGLIAPVVVEQLFVEFAREQKAKNAAITVTNEIPVIVTPFIGRLSNHEGVERSGLPFLIAPLIVRATLTKNGELKSGGEADAFWIPRAHLEPVAGEGPTLGSVEQYEAGASQTANVENETWDELLQRATDLLDTVSEEKWQPLQEWNAYTFLPESGLRVDTEINASQYLLRLYDVLTSRKNPPLPPLLRNFAADVRAPLKPPLESSEILRRSSQHLGQLGAAFSLSPSQRETLSYFLQMKKGDILAVNGPPGTGKTTLLHSVVATLWVEAALAGGEPPLIAAVSANNQAVTNVIDSFGKASEPADHPLAGRWLPEIFSYGLYLVAKSRWQQAEKFQAISNRGEGFARDIQNLQFIAKASANYLENVSRYFGKPTETVEQATRKLKNLLKRKSKDLEALVDAAASWVEIHDELSQKYGSVNEVEVTLANLEKEKNSLARAGEDLNGFWFEWLQQRLQQSWLWQLLSGFKFFENRLNLQDLLFFAAKSVSELRSKLEMAPYRLRTGLIAESRSALSKRASNNEALLNEVRKDKEKFAVAQKQWLQLLSKHRLSKSVSKPEDLNAVLDVTLRYEMFKIATHYWEGRWLQEVETITDFGVEEKLSVTKQTRRWQRYAKLTPCFVSTFYMLPDFFKSWQGEYAPLDEVLDLLIIDEAGQVSPEVAGACFTLAKKAFVVGDMKQIEPVWSITEKIDRANLTKWKVASTASEIENFLESGLSVSSGSVMQVAQNACAYQKFADAERGLFLTEHRRCFDPLIQYCNELCYARKLTSLRPLEARPFRPFLHIHEEGQCDLTGGSRRNRREAEAIVQWLTSEGPRLEQAYHQPLARICSVITPFSSQKYLAQTLLQKAARQHPFLAGVEVGTVHAYQGAERPVILFSSVYDPSTPGYAGPGFLDRAPNLLNVAVSRAQDSFIVFGHRDVFRFGAGRKTPTSLLGKYLFGGGT